MMYRTLERSIAALLTLFILSTASVVPTFLRAGETVEVQSQATKGEASTTNSPNIVVLMADDWSWPHAGVLGDPVVQTPNFDRVAREGGLFPNAFVSTPSCTPSRLSILTGQDHWRLREGDSLGGSLREEYPVYSELLQTAGYHVGRYGKGVWPSKHAFRNRDSFGTRYKSFDHFLENRNSGKPFCYWHGGQDPHRPYELGVGAKSGIRLSDVKVPACLPDNETTRGDVADYLWEVQRFDREVGEVLERLERLGELEDSIVVVSGDNGMPFPRCKATLYDQGTRVPLAIRWGANVQGGRTVSDFVNLCDLAPTFLEAAGLEIPKQMTGRSLLPILTSDQSERVEPERTFVVTGMEQHVYPYPSRALRTNEFLYVHNFDPKNWPTGEVEGKNPEFDFAVQPWPTVRGAFSFNIDPSPTKQFLRLHRDEPESSRFAKLAFDQPPKQELFDLTNDPEQLTNVAGKPEYEETLQKLRAKLTAELIKRDDPQFRVEGYSTQVIERWPVRISDRLFSDELQETTKALELLADQLRIVRRVLPPQALERLIDVPIWLSPPYVGARPTGEYHPGKHWLKQNGRPLQMHRCVEFTNTRSFERDIKRMPVMVLHELAHAYHDQVFGYDNQKIRDAFRNAEERGLYESVLRSDGKTVRAYALNNPMEYFAESSEAFFGTNDFYPFNREQLKRHDPNMEKLLVEIWGASDERLNVQR